MHVLINPKVAKMQNKFAAQIQSISKDCNHLNILQRIAYCIDTYCNYMSWLLSVDVSNYAKYCLQIKSTLNEK